METIRYLSESGIGMIGLADTGSGNRLHAGSLADLRAALERAIAETAVRVILIRSHGGPGDPWCLGMDLDKLGTSLKSKESADMSEDSGGRSEAVAAYGDLLLRIVTCPKPVVACIGGPVKAGGVGLAAACDIVVASSSASFELSEVIFGLIPANVLPVLIGRRMSPQRARWLILSARRLDNKEAFSVGLADETPPDEEAEAVIRNLCKALLRAEPGALAETKSFIDFLERTEAEAGRKAAQKKILDLMLRPEVETAIAAFSEGGTPPWFSKFKPGRPVFWEKETT